MRLIRNIGLAIGLIFALSGEVSAQGCGPTNPGCIVPTAPPGTNNNQAASTAFVHNAVSGVGTVTSVGLALPSSVFIVSGSPVTTAGTLTGTLQTQAANTAWLGPTTGSAAAPTFRALVGADLPNPSATTLGGIESYVAVTNQWINAISTSGVPSSTQPAFSNLSGQIGLTQLPTISNLTALGNVSGASTTPTAISVREKLTAVRDYYVSSTGNDANVCSNASPCATYKHVWDYVQNNLDLNGLAPAVRVNLLSSLSFTTSQVLSGDLTGSIGPSSFIIQGNTSNAATFTVSSSTASVYTFQAQYGANFTVQWLTASSSGSGAGVVLINNDGYVLFNNLIFSGSGGNTFVDTAGNKASASCTGPITISGSVNIAYAAEDLSWMSLNCVHTISGTPAWGTGFVVTDLGGMIDATGFTFSGAGATGSKAVATLNGIIFSGGVACTGSFFPGTIDTPPATGGICGSTWSGASVAGSNTQVQFNNSGGFGASANLTWVSPKLTIGASGTSGQLGLVGSGSGSVTQTAQAAAGTPTITWGTSSGTPAATATSPLAINSTTGNITCAGCLTNSPAALTKTDDTNVTLTLGGTPATSLLQATSLTLGWTGQLGLTRGGTNNTLTASNGGVVWSDASKLNILSGTATANLPLISGATATPAWAAITYPTSATSGGIAYFSSTTAMASSGLLTANLPVIGGGAGVAPTVGTRSGNTTAFVTTTGAQTSGNCVSIDASGNHIASGSGCGSTVTPAALTKADDTNVTLTLGGTPATALLQASSITAGWTGTLGASRGGFGSDVSAAAGVPLFAAGVPTFTSTSGTGNFVRVTSPTLVTPVLGVATGTSLALGGCTISTNAFCATGHMLIEGVTSTGATGTGNFVFSATPTLTGTPILASPSATKLIVGSSTTFPSGDVVTVTNNTTTLPANSGGSLFHMGSADGAAAAMVFDSFATNNTFSFRRADTSAAAPSAIQSGETVMNMVALGYGSTTYSAAARAAVRSTAAENWSDTAQGMYITLQTTPTTTASLAEAVRIQASGGVSIGTSTDPGIGSLQINAQQFNPNMTADTGIADSTVCTATTGGKLLKGTGTLGICLGTSGAQFKNIKGPMKAGLDEIIKIKLWDYTYKDGYGDSGLKPQRGPTAQDVEKVIPDLVGHNAKGEAINYDMGAFIPMSLHAIQQLNEKITKLEAANDNMNAELHKLRVAR